MGELQQPKGLLIRTTHSVKHSNDRPQQQCKHGLRSRADSTWKSTSGKDKHRESPSVRSAFQKHGFEIRAIDARLQAVPQVSTDFTSGSLLVLQAYIIHISEPSNGTQPGSENEAGTKIIRRTEQLGNLNKNMFMLQNDVSR